MEIIGPWMQTHSGIAFDLLNPKPDMVRLDDIAVHLSRLNRFAGATREPWSVLQHSLLCMGLSHDYDDPHPSLDLAAVLHDAHEAYIGDIITPVRVALDVLDFPSPSGPSSLRVLQTRVQAAINEHFGYVEKPGESEEIKRIDLLALAIEKFCLLGKSPRPWIQLPEITIHDVKKFEDVNEFRHKDLVSLYKGCINGSLTEMGIVWSGL